MFNEERIAVFWTRVDKTESCWLWTGGKNQNGYGRITIEYKRLSVHRVAYQLLVGPIPEGLDLDHLCRVRNCVNPKHLQPVTHAENLRRGIYPNSLKTRCPKGHPYSPSNTYFYKFKDGRKDRRSCVLCRKSISHHKKKEPLLGF